MTEADLHGCGSCFSLQWSGMSGNSVMWIGDQYSLCGRPWQVNILLPVLLVPSASVERLSQHAEDERSQRMARQQPGTHSPSVAMSR